MNKKGFLDISFSWIFAFIIGGFIIFGAVYGLNKFTDIEQTKSSAVSGTEFGNILNTFETSSEAATSVAITFPLQSRLQFDCISRGTFGKQDIIIDELVNNKWSDTGFSIALKNKYVFSENFIEGKNFYAFSKPFKFPFKVANLIYLTLGEKNYCFIDPPRKIKSEINDLNQINLITKECTDKTAIRICFDGGSDCDIEVDYNGDFLIKDDETFPFEGDAMMYAAIFSDKETYECGVKRLMSRTEGLSELYMDKSIFLANRCDSRLGADLGSFKSLLENYKSSEGLSQLVKTKDLLDSKNKYSGCKLW